MAGRQPALPTEHYSKCTRRWLLKFGGSGIAALSLSTRLVSTDETHPTLIDALEELESYFTRQDDFQDVSRGRPRPHQLDQATKEQVGLTRDTWKLSVDIDPEHPATIANPISSANGNLFTFADLMSLAETNSVRFAKVMTCLNIGCPLGMGIWEGVPLRDVIWLARPEANLRRVYYYGYHNDDPRQIFQSSLPVGRILEDYHDLPPVILCYKLNGEWLTPERGGPVRIIVPEAYGFKCVKWLTNIHLSNLAVANDTYAKQNNDVDSPLKSFAATLTVPTQADERAPFAVTGYGQVGISGVSRVQVWIQPAQDSWPDSDPYFTEAPWQDAEILPPPENWGAEYETQALPSPLMGFEPDTGRPQSWPLPLSKIQWGYLHAGLPSGSYVLRCRTIDDNGIAQPMPRPFQKSGHAAIEEVQFEVA